MDWKLTELLQVDSTNDEIKRRVAQGAAEGLAVLARCQTQGRGRVGRSFSSPADKGMYLSVLLKPQCTPRERLWLTAWAAVAAADSVEKLCGVRPGIKWVNDLVLGGKKLGGILTEGVGETLVLGIGINLTQTETDFGPQLAPVATSLAAQLGKAPSAGELAHAVLKALGNMYRDFPAKREEYWKRYRTNCLTLNQPVRVLHPEGVRPGFSKDLNEDFGLMVAYPDGTAETVTAGEVSVRGLWGYAE